MRVALVFVAMILGGECFSNVQESVGSLVICKNSRQVRTLRVIDADGRGCSIGYSKFGSEEMVGAGRSVAMCESVLKSIQANLLDAKWNCRSVAKVRSIVGDGVN